MLSLFRFISWRHLAGERLKTLLAVVGVALGIAVFLSIRLANGSVLGAFRNTVDAVSGKAQLQAVGGPRGLPDAAYLKARSVPGVGAVAPVVQATVMAPDWGDAAVSVLGVDVFSEPPFRTFTLEAGGDPRAAAVFLGDPRAIAVGERLAQEHGLKPGSRIRLSFGTSTRTWRVVSIPRSDALGRAYAGRLAVVDIAAAQEAFGKVGRLSRLDILPAPGANLASVQRGLSAALGPDVTVERPRRRGAQVESLLAAFQLNLTALSAIAIFVGMFLIYNAMSIAVVRRRREIGILRELGTTRRQVLAMFLAEGGVYGVLGSVLGVALGIALARAALSGVATTVSTLYVRVEADRLLLSPAVIAQSVALGMGTALLASLAPALEAAGTPPGQSTREGSLSEKTRRAVMWVTIAGLAVLCSAVLLSWAATEYRVAFLGLVAAFAILGGFSLLSPALTAGMSRIARPAWDRLFGAEGLLAAGYVSASLDRTSVVVAALMVSLAMFVGVSVMVGSFRRTVQAWVDQTVTADLFLQPRTLDASGSDATMPKAVLRGLYTIPGVKSIDAYRDVVSEYQGRRIILFAATFDVLARDGKLLFRRGDTGGIATRARERGEVIITEAFATKFRKREGDMLTLTTPDGPRPFRIAGVFYDYASSGPLVALDRGLYRRVWHDDSVNSAAIYLRPDADLERTRAEMERRFNRGGGLEITSNRELNTQVMNIFDQTFRVTYALEFISIAVAVLGIVNTMTALIVQRGREQGVLRAVGATRAQLQRIILLESGLIGLIAYVIGAACGSALAVELITVINKQFFGWTIQSRWDATVFVQGAAIVVVTSVAAGLIPARQAGRRPVMEAVRTE